MTAAAAVRGGGGEREKRLMPLPANQRMGERDTTSTPVHAGTRVPAITPGAYPGWGACKTGFSNIQNKTFFKKGTYVPIQTINIKIFVAPNLFSGHAPSCVRKYEISSPSQTFPCVS